MSFFDYHCWKQLSVLPQEWIQVRKHHHLNHYHHFFPNSSPVCLAAFSPLSYTAPSVINTPVQRWKLHILSSLPSPSQTGPPSTMPQPSKAHPYSTTPFPSPSPNDIFPMVFSEIHVPDKLISCRHMRRTAGKVWELETASHINKVLASQRQEQLCEGHYSDL